MRYGGISLLAPKNNSLYSLTCFGVYYFEPGVFKQVSPNLSVFAPQSKGAAALDKGSQKFKQNFLRSQLVPGKPKPNDMSRFTSATRPAPTEPNGLPTPSSKALIQSLRVVGSLNIYKRYMAKGFAQLL